MMDILDRLRKLASGEIEGEIKQFEYSLAADEIKRLQSDNRDLTKCNFELHNARNYADELMDANGFSSLTELLVETKKREKSILQLQADNQYLKNSEAVLANNVTKLYAENTKILLYNDILIVALKFYEGFSDSRISSIAQTALHNLSTQPSTTPAKHDEAIRREEREACAEVEESWASARVKPICTSLLNCATAIRARVGK